MLTSSSERQTLTFDISKWASCIYVFI
jgi:hypothetical protein